MIEFRKMLIPSIVGGFAASAFTVAISVVSNILHFVGICNLACCLWLIGGGVLAAYLLKSGVGRIGLKDGAVVGALSGFFFAVICTFFVVVMVFIGVGLNLAVMQQIGGEEVAGAAAIGLIAILFVFGIYLVLGMVFCAVGGVLGAKLFEK